MRICDRCQGRDGVLPSRVMLQVSPEGHDFKPLITEGIDLCEECRDDTREQIKAIFQPVAPAKPVKKPRKATEV